MGEFTVQVAEWLPFVAFLIPLIVGFLTKVNAPDGLKTFVMLVVTSVATLTNQLTVDGAEVLTSETFYAWLGTTVITITSYYGLWKPLNVTNHILPERGLGQGD